MQTHRVMFYMQKWPLLKQLRKIGRASAVGGKREKEKVTVLGVEDEGISDWLLPCRDAVLYSRPLVSPLASQLAFLSFYFLSLFLVFRY